MKNLIRDKKEAEKIIGKRVKIINSIGSHSVPVGTFVNLTGTYLSNSTWLFYNTYSNSVLRSTNFDICPETKEDIQKDLEKLRDYFKKEESILKSKLEFMKEIGSEKFDETEFKTYHTLTLLENSKLSKREKSKLIASLINS